MKLSRAVNTTNTSYIRASIQHRIEEEGLDGPPVELVSFHVFIYCTSGTGHHMVDFEHHEIKRGTAIWIRPGQVQRWCSDDDFHAEVVVFASSTIPDLPLFQHLLGTTAIAQLSGDTDRLQQQIEWMSADLEASQDEATAAAAVGVILRVFARHAQGDDQSQNTERIRLATAFVDSVDGRLEERSVTWHAHQIGASTRSIARATAEALGQRPKEVIDARVILEARRRLAWSTDDVSTIARALHFSDSSNFTKYFRARTGTSPSAFRDAITDLAPDRAES